MPKEAGVILFLIVLGLIAYLLITRHIGSAAFTVLFVVSVVALVLLVRIDEIKRLFVDVRAGQLVADLEHVRQDIYAKVEAVQRLGEIVAATSALQLSKLGRYGGAPNLERLQAERKRFAEMLRDLGTDPQRSDEILLPLDVIMTYDLAGSVTEAARIEIQNRRGPAKDGEAVAALNQEVDEMQRLVRAALLEAPSAEASGRAEQVLREKACGRARLLPLSTAFGTSVPQWNLQRSRNTLARSSESSLPTQLPTTAALINDAHRRNCGWTAGCTASSCWCSPSGLTSPW